MVSRQIINESVWWIGLFRTQVDDKFREADQDWWLAREVLKGSLVESDHR